MHPVDDNHSRQEPEALLLFHYDELPAAEMQRMCERLASDSQLAAEYAELVAFLESVEDPHATEFPDDFYGRRLAARVNEKLPPDSHARTPAGLEWRWLGGGLAAAMALAVVFMLGRFSAEPLVDPTNEPLLVENASSNGRQNGEQDAGQLQARLLNASLSQHLEASSRFLRQVDNANPSTTDVEAEKNWAATLLVANRLYRFAAEQAGQHRVAAVLQDMEPVLIEMANREGELSDEEFSRLRQRIQAQDLLFKVDVTSKAMAPNRKRGDSI